MGNKLSKPQVADDITFTDRLLTGFFSAVVVFIIAAGAPLALLILSRGRAMEALVIYNTFHAWGLAMTLFGAFVGFAAGSERAIVLFGHLCGTELPRRAGVTTLLWAALLCMALIGFLLAAS